LKVVPAPVIIPLGGPSGEIAAGFFLKTPVGLSRHTRRVKETAATVAAALKLSQHSNFGIFAQVLWTCGRPKDESV